MWGQGRASRLARGPADAAVFAGRRRAPAPAARPGDRRGQGPRLEHVRGDRPRLGNRPGRNETSTLYRRGGAARQASGGAVASGTRSGTTPAMSGLDREHADVSGYGASRVGRSAHVWSGIPGTPGPRSRPPMRLSRRGDPSVPSAEDAVPPRSTPDGGCRYGPPVPGRYRGLAGRRDDRARYPGAGGCLIPWRFRTRPESWSAPPHRTSGRCRLSTGKPRSPRPRVGPIAANVRPS